MGRSRMGLAIRKEVFEKEGKIIKDSLERCDSVKLHEDFYYCYWESYKYYPETDPDDQKLNDFIDEHYDDVKFIRIGDDGDSDIETDGGADAPMYLERKVDFPEELEKAAELNVEELFETTSVKLIKQFDDEEDGHPVAHQASGGSNENE